MKRQSILLILPIIICCCISRPKTNDQSAKKEAELKSGNTTIHYLEQGSGDTTLLFVHGWCINSTYWDNQLNYFGPEYRVIAIDLPGFGKSTSNRKLWSVQEYGNDVTSFINQLGLKNVIIIGHSMSGDVMLEAALKNNPAIIGLIGIDNFSMVGVQYTPEQMEQMKVYFSMLTNNFKTFSRNYAENMLFIKDSDSTSKARVKDDFANADSAIAIATLKEVADYDSIEEAGLEQLNYKLYIINCVDLYPTNRAGLEKHCKNSFEISEIKGTGHYPMIEKPDEFNLLLQQIIRKITKG